MSINGEDSKLQESFKGGICSSKASEEEHDSRRLETEEVYSFTLVWEVKKIVNVLYTAKECVLSPLFMLKSFFSSEWRFSLGADPENGDGFTITLTCIDVPEEFKENYVTLTMSMRIENLILATHYGCKSLHSLEEDGFYLEAYAPKIDAEEIEKSSDEDLIVECNLTFHQFRDSKIRKAYDSLSADFSRLLESRDFSDFELRVGNLTFPVHKVVLWTRAKKLAEHFGISQPSASSFNVTDVDVDVLKALIHFLYSGEVTTQNESCFAELLKMGEIFEIRDLKTCFFVRKIVAQTSHRTERNSFTWPITYFDPSYSSETVLEFHLERFEFAFVFTFKIKDYFVLIAMRKISPAQNPGLPTSNAKTSVFVAIDAIGERSSYRIVEQRRFQIGQSKRTLKVKYQFEELLENGGVAKLLIGETLTFI